MGKRKRSALDNFIDSVNEHNLREQRGGCKFLIIGTSVVLVLGIVMMIIGAIMAIVEENTVVSTYGEQYANLCSPMPAGNDSLDNTPQGETPLKLFVLMANTRQRHAWFQDVPTLWRAESQTEVGLGACIEEEKVTLETCSYERASSRGDGSYHINIDRVQYNATVVLINPTTGRRIDSLTLTGAEPDACPADNPELKSSQTVSGEKLTFDDIATWIEPFVFGEEIPR
jgi:hypothetical protein